MNSHKNPSKRLIGHFLHSADLEKMADQEQIIVEAFLALADEVNESAIEHHFERTEKLLENESLRTELNKFVKSNAGMCEEFSLGWFIFSFLN